SVPLAKSNYSSTRPPPRVTIPPSHLHLRREDNLMMISKRALPRRTFLKGVGATLALPLLDAMVPAATALAKTAAAPVKRLGFVFMPMGCDQSRWTPPGETLDVLSPILSSLEPVKKYVSVLSNME